MIVGCLRLNKGPEFYLDAPNQRKREIDLFLDRVSGKGAFLDKVAYYFDAKFHGFKEINGVKIDEYKSYIENEILELKKEYNIVQVKSLL